VKLEVHLTRAPLRAPFVSSVDSVDVRELLLLRLEDADGCFGFGEAAPLPGHDGVRISDVQVGLEDCREVLGRGESLGHAELLRQCSALGVLPATLAAIDLALWDLAGRRAGVPVWRLLRADAVGEAIEVNATIGAIDRAGAADQAATAVRAGFRTLKLKVGVGDDAGRVAAVRAAAGPHVGLRLDANGVWSPLQAAASLRALEPAGIELCEEPVHGLEQIAELSALTSVPLAIDETAAQPGALERRVADAVCLKVARCGGIGRLLSAAALARASGYRLYLASMLDGPLGIAAGLHAAAAVAPELPCGLATLPLFADREDPLPARDGRIALPRGAGLGDDLERWYT